MYQHDDNNNKIQVTYPSGKVVTITPDALDRIINIKDASGDPNTFLASYTYEGKGKILEKILQNGITMNAVFDDGRRPVIISYKYKDYDYTLIERAMSWNLTDLKKFDYEAGKTETFKYDSSYRLRNVNNQKNNSSNEDGHIVSISEDTNIPPTSFQYNNGLIQNVTFPRGNSMAYDYNEGILTTITESPGSDDTPDKEYPVEPNRVTSFNYEEFTKNLLSIFYPNSLKQNYTYNEYGQVTSEAANLFYEDQDTPLGQTIFMNITRNRFPMELKLPRKVPVC